MIVIVEDEGDIRELVKMHLERAGFDVKGYPDAKLFLRSLSSRVPELIILDLMLPGTDGLELCKFLKNEPRYRTVPIIMLTARTDETDKVLGLELGADDYVTKPFSPKELVARVKAVLRRHDAKTQGKTINPGKNLVIHRDTYEVYQDGKPLILTATEFKILELLALHQGTVFTRDKILNHLWGEEKAVLDRTVDVHIRNLRMKLGKIGLRIKNIRGIGYKMEL